MTNFENWCNPLNLGEMRIEQNNTDEPIIMLTSENQSFGNPFNYKVITSDGQGGGAIVLFPKDIAFHIVVENSIIIDILNRLKIALKEIDIDSFVDGNDLIIAGHKILGSTSRRYGDYLIEGFFISFNNDLDIINQITFKKIGKTPIGASLYGITPEFILNFLNTIAEIYNFKILEETIKNDNDSIQDKEVIKKPRIKDFESQVEYEAAMLKYKESIEEE